MTNNRAFYIPLIVIFIVLEATVASVFLYRGAQIKDILWCLPLIILFGTVSLFLLDYYCFYRDIDRKNTGLGELK